MEERPENKIVDELADEIVELLSNSQKFSKFIDRIDSNESSLENEMQNRVENIGQKLDKTIQKFKLVSLELDRLSTKRTETLRSEHDDEIAKINAKIENLRQAVIKLASEIKDIKESRF